MRVLSALVFLATVALTTWAPAAAEDAVPAARQLLAAWHEEPARIDRARTLLEAEAPRGTPETLVELSNVWFLTGEFRARNDAERIGAYEQGSEYARRAIAAAPNNEHAHFLLAINTGRLAEMRGVMRAVTLVSKIRE